MRVAEKQITLTRQQHPLLYWTTLLYVLQYPNFVHFDASGRVGDALNFSSILGIVVAVIAGYLLILMLLLERKPVLERKVHVDLGLWILLLLELSMASIMEPHSRLTAPSMGSPFITVFRLGQWCVAFGLILALYSRTAHERATELMVQIIGRVCWIWMAMVYFILPLYPSQVYGVGEENTDAVPRLGGGLAGPAALALYASLGFFYALLFFPKGPRKVFCCLLAVVTVYLTRARFQQANFVFALLVYLVIVSRKSVVRWATIAVALFMVIAALPFSNKISDSIARGQSLQTLSTLDDRTRVWQAAWDAIKVRPIIGYGYNQGAKHALRDYWTYHHWIPPHAHNEFIEFWLAGGIIALAIVVYLYGHFFVVAWRDVHRSPYQLFLFIAFLHFALNTISGGALSFVYMPSGGLFVLAFIGTVGGTLQPLSKRTLVPRLSLERRSAVIS